MIMTKVINDWILYSCYLVFLTKVTHVQLPITRKGWFDEVKIKRLSGRGLSAAESKLIGKV